jgi:hypothetical protein
MKGIYDALFDPSCFNGTDPPSVEQLLIMLNFIGTGLTQYRTKEDGRREIVSSTSMLAMASTVADLCPHRIPKHSRNSCLIFRILSLFISIHDSCEPSTTAPSHSLCLNEHFRFDIISLTMNRRPDGTWWTGLKRNSNILAIEHEARRPLRGQSLSMVHRRSATTATIRLSKRLMQPSVRCGRFDSRFFPATGLPYPKRRSLSFSSRAYQIPSWPMRTSRGKSLSTEVFSPVNQRELKQGARLLAPIA